MSKLKRDVVEEIMVRVYPYRVRPDLLRRRLRRAISRAVNLGIEYGQCSIGQENFDNELRKLGVKP